MSVRLGVDIGGTFTDLVLHQADGDVRHWKVPSTPPAFDQGVLDGIAAAASDLGVTSRDLLDRLDEFVHGTTVTTNVVLTRTGERVGLLTTAGFGDLYEQARQYRNGEQDPAKVGHPRPLVPRGDIAEVHERIDFQGRIVIPIDVDGMRASVRRLRDEGIRSFAICFLWAFRNPEHERAAKAVIEEEVPGAYVAASFEACPLLGEYERTSTTAITAFAGPALGVYAQRLEQRLRDEGFDGTLLLMKSDGGLGSIESAVRTAGQTVYSGPVAGVMGAKALGRAIESGDLITFDMGGTSTDVGLVHGGDVRRTNLQFLDQQALATPMVDVTTVGAGGGSIAWAGPGGVLRVGPQSAGALPGAACYGRGGELPTVTDANVVLGLIDPDYFLGGRMQLDAGAAERVIGGVAEELSLAPMAAAAGIFRVVNSVMADAIRLRTVFAGLDPRSFALVSFGGAGGLHAASVAQELRIGRVIVPAAASVFSAAGLISTDIVYSAGTSTHQTLEPGSGLNADGLDHLNAAFEILDEEVRTAFAAHDLPAEDIEISHAIDLCYLRQILDFEIEVPARALQAGDVTDAVRAFDERYARIYGEGAAAPDAGYDLKAYRVTGVGRIALGGANGSGQPTRYEPEPAARRRALPHAHATELEELPVHPASGLKPGAAIAGPALIDYDDTTVLVPSGWTAAVDARADLILEAS